MRRPSPVSASLMFGMLLGASASRADTPGTAAQPPDVSGAGAAIPASPAPAPAPGVPSPGSSVPVVVPAGDTAVTAAVAALGAWAASAHAHLGTAVLDVGTGSVLAAAHEHELVNPASNTKVLTTATVLDRMGPDYRFTTGLFGHLDGDTVSELVLRGNGDPSLDAARLFELATALRALGVRHVGRLLVDQSYFDDRFVPPAFEQQPNEWAPFRAPVSAVSLGRNTVTLNVLARQEGSAAAIWFEPAGFVDVHGAIATRRPGAASAIRVTLSPKGPRLLADVGGYAGAGPTRLRYGKRADDPRLLAGYALKATLRDLGIDVTTDVAQGGESARERLASIDSEPLSVLVRELGKNSDNFYAETLLKALGGFLRGAPAHSQDGAEAVLAWIGAAGALEPGTRFINGSGLFDANRVSALELATVLRVAYQSPRIGPDFVAQLSIGGVDGTLGSRFSAEAKRRIIRAKTGTLDGVIALSGYVLAPPGRAPIAYSFILTGVSGHHAEARARLDRAVEAIAGTLWASDGPRPDDTARAHL